MVKSLVLAVVLALGPGAASGQTVDWQRAGGDLFGRNGVTEAGPGPAEVIRIEPLSQPYQAAIAEAAEAHGLDQKLLHALVLTESAYRSEAISPAGAAGLTQLMPATAQEMGVANRLDPEQNLRGGADYLARQIVRFQDLRLALAAYNSGPGRVARLGRVPDIPETQQYVTSVIECYLALTVGRAVRTAGQCSPRGHQP
ncbi:lytic transglycosylase domain-containing protein [Brevundimonas sp.]